MGFRQFHHIAVSEVTPYCDYLSSETSPTWGSPFREESTILLPSLPEQLSGAWQTLSVALVTWQASKFRCKTGECFCHLNLPYPQRLSICLGKKKPLCAASIHSQGLPDTAFPTLTALQLTDPSAGRRGREKASKVMHQSEVVKAGQTGFYRSATTTSVIHLIIYYIVL